MIQNLYFTYYLGHHISLSNYHTFEHQNIAKVRQETVFESHDKGKKSTSEVTCIFQKYQKIRISKLSNQSKIYIRIISKTSIY